MMLVFFFFNHTATTAIYTLSLHDALPIFSPRHQRPRCVTYSVIPSGASPALSRRSEEHTSELQSRFDLVCRLLLEKKNKSRLGPGRARLPEPAGVRTHLPTRRPRYARRHR